MSRDAILAKVRDAVSGAGGTERVTAVHERLEEAARATGPGAARHSMAEWPGQFQTALEHQTAAVIRVAKAADIPQAVAGYLSSVGAAATLRAGSDRALASLSWTEAGVSIQPGAATAADAVGLSVALAGIAETGTLVLASSAENPASLAFLPETHIVVIDAARIVGGMEEAFDLVRGAFGRGQMPRALNLISGPSRTGDIGGRIVLGAHGPRRLCVVVVDG